MYDAGIRYLVVDKDNCLTHPHDNRLVEAIRPAWEQCKDVFGPDNILLVSNTAGTRKDPLGVDAENMSAALGVPVLCHAVPKPARSCARQIVQHVRELASQVTELDHVPRVACIGDRTLTDIVLAHRINALLVRQFAHRAMPDWEDTDVGEQTPIPLSVGVLTTQLWVREGAGAMFMRRLEQIAMRQLLARGVVPGGSWWSRSTPAPVIPSFISVPAASETAPVTAAPAPAATVPTSRDALGAQVLREMFQAYAPPRLVRVCTWIAGAWRRFAAIPPVSRVLSRIHALVRAAGSAAYAGMQESSIKTRPTWWLSTGARRPRVSDMQRDGVPGSRRTFATCAPRARVRQPRTPPPGETPLPKGTSTRRSLLFRRLMLTCAVIIILPLGFFTGVKLNEVIERWRAGDLSNEGGEAASGEQAAPAPEPVVPAATGESAAELRRRIQRYVHGDRLRS